MTPCVCELPHPGRKIVITGGPGAGKTAVLELARQTLCSHARVLPEAASILFRGGFPRGATTLERRPAQRAIYSVQCELEAVYAAMDGAAMYLCDRGTIDGMAYWPGPDDFWSALGTTREAELLKYHAVIHLRTPSLEQGYNHANPVRTESALEAAAIDERVAMAWQDHPRRYFIASTDNFLEKAHAALEIIRRELPECCRGVSLAALGI